MKNVLSILLALFLLSSQIGLALGTHFCGGMAVESKVMIGHEKLDCGMGDMDKDCESRSDFRTYLNKMSCCDNDYLSIEIEDEYTTKVIQSNLNVGFVTAFVVSYIQLFSTDHEKPKHANYNHPLVPRDISLLHQVFII